MALVELMQKIILFYKFTPVHDPIMTMRWQRELCLRLQLKGRVIIAEHGINGTLGGELKDLKAYVKAMNQTSEFKSIEYKWSEGGRDDFPRLSIKVRQELVTLAPDETFDVYNTGTPLRPEAWHAYLAAHPDAIVLDARNEYESDIGSFQNAVKPKIKTFREIKTTLRKLPKDKPVLTYCTGDIRCEYLSSYMKHQGFQEVYHLDGGIMKYGEQYGDGGFWEGKCYVFDRRMKLAFSNKAQDIGQCSRCRTKTSNHENCANKQCNKLILLCENCFNHHPLCSVSCENSITSIV